MTLVGTSVLIAQARTRDPKLLALIQAHNGHVCGVVRAEMLHGARSAAHRGQILATLGYLGLLPTPDVVWDRVGDNLAALRRAGVNLYLPDVAIATVAMFHGVELWTRDAHFGLMTPVLPALRLFAEPP